MTTPIPTRLGRVELTLLLSMCMAIVALAIDISLPVLGEIRSGYGLAEDSTQAAAVVTAFLVGFAAAQVVWGPLSDHFGRKPILYAGLAGYAAAALASALAPSLPALLAARFFWGVAAAGPRVVTLSVIRDTHEGEAMAKAMSFIMAVFIIVPVIAPSVGAVIGSGLGWRWVFGFCVVWVLVMGVWVRRLPETLAGADRLELTYRRVRVAFGTVVTNRDTAGYTLALTFLFGLFSSYLASSEIIIDRVFGMADAFPFVFGGIATVMGLAMLANGAIVDRVGTRRLAHLALVTYLVLAATLLAVALATGGRPPFWAFAAVIAPMLACHALLLPNFNTIALLPMAAIAATAAAVIGAVSTGLGAALGALLDRSFDGTILPFAAGAAVYGGMALAAVVWAERGMLFRPLSAAVSSQSTGTST